MATLHRLTFPVIKRGVLISKKNCVDKGLGGECIGYVGFYISFKSALLISSIRCIGTSSHNYRDPNGSNGRARETIQTYGLKWLKKLHLINPISLLFSLNDVYLLPSYHYRLQLHTVLNIFYNCP